MRPLWKLEFQIPLWYNLKATEKVPPFLVCFLVSFPSPGNAAAAHSSRPVVVTSSVPEDKALVLIPEAGEEGTEQAKRGKPKSSAARLLSQRRESSDRVGGLARRMGLHWGFAVTTVCLWAEHPNVLHLSFPISTMGIASDRKCWWEKV